MKVLTVQQPWAGLILRHGKDIENRSWKTRVRGRIAIHSSARLSRGEVKSASDLLSDPEFAHLACVGISEFHGREFATGHILGTVEIVDCVQGSDSPWFFGPYGFVLRNPVMLDNPIRVKGQLGFWQWDIPDPLAGVSGIRGGMNV